MVKFIAISSMLAYSINTGWLAWQLHRQAPSRPSLLFAWLAAGLHTLYFGLLCQQQNGFSFSVLNMASLNMLGVVLILLLAATTKPIEKLGLVLFPLAAIILGLDATIMSSPRLLLVHSGAMAVHILTSVLAFSLLMVAAFQAILLAIQHNQLKFMILSNNLLLVLE